MCFLHVVLWLVRKSCQRSNPGHDNERQWNAHTFYLATGLAITTACFFSLLSVLLEFLRESRRLGYATRLQTSWPMLCAMLLIASLAFEFICMYSTLHDSGEVAPYDLEEPLDRGVIAADDTNDEEEGTNSRSRRLASFSTAAVLPAVE